MGRDGGGDKIKVLEKDEEFFDDDDAISASTALKREAEQRRRRREQAKSVLADEELDEETAALQQKVKIGWARMYEKGEVLEDDELEQLEQWTAELEFKRVRRASALGLAA